MRVLRSLMRLEEGWTTFALLSLVVFSAVWSVQAAGWVDNIEVLTWIAAGALLLGLVWSRLNYSEWLLHLSATTVGAISLALLISRVTWQGMEWQTRLASLWYRVIGWMAVAVSGGVGDDNLLFLVLLGVTAWLVGYVGAWAVFRDHGPWWPILCNGCALVVNESYAAGNPLHIVIFLASSMLLVLRLNLYKQKREWRQDGVQFSPGIGGRITRAGVMLAAGALIVSSFVPKVSGSALDSVTSYVRQPWEDVQIEFSRLFGGVQARDQELVSGFSDSIVPRSSFRLADTVVMYVESDEPLYWRATVYERYTGRGWLAPASTFHVLVDGTDLNLGDALLETYLEREEVLQEFRLAQSRGNVVLAAADVQWITIRVRAEYEAVTTEDGDQLLVGVATLRSPVTLRPGLRYSAISSVSRASAQQLREAGTDYPAWIASYLQLPRVPARVWDLSTSVTQGHNNPYDKVIAVERFVRGFPYTLDATPPPRGRDWVDYFLFDLQEGYCDYFSAAMTVMLRTQGIPARVVSGYATGDWDAQGQRYLVRDLHAHSWVEVYFPAYGWVPFEPSGYRPLPPRAEGAPLPSQTEAPSLSQPDPRAQLGELEDRAADVLPMAQETPDDGWWRGLADRGPLVLALLLVSLGTWLGLIYAWRKGLEGIAPAELPYARVSQLASWLGIGPKPAQTPTEYGHVLTDLVPEQKEGVTHIVNAYVGHRFGRQEPSNQENYRLARAWLSLRGALLWARLRRPRYR